MSEITVVHDGTDLVPVGAELEPVPVDDDPRVQAEARFALLKSSFASVITVIGKMHVDEDWRHLTRPDGTPYSSLSGVVSDALHLSLSMARRYVQGAKGFYLPLMDFTVEGTVIPITSGDVTALGSEGLEEAAEDAKARIEDLTDPGEQSEAIAGALSDARERRERAGSGADDDDDWADDDGDDGDAIVFGGGAEGSSVGRFDEGRESRPSSAPGDDDGGFADDDGDRDSVDLTDPVARVMEGAQTYATPEDLALLPEDLREIVAALVTLAEMDSSVLAKTVSYDTRGVLVPMDAALANMTRFRALVETLPWFMHHLTA